MAATTAPQYLKQRVSENNGRPWTQNPDYIEACRTVSRLGDPTSYNPPHPHGPSQTDRTQFSVGLAGFHEHNLPDVFYQLWPSKEWWDHAKSAKPPQKVDVYGSLMYERTPRSSTPRALLDFPILRNLDTISSEAPAWFLELLMRMDGRLDWADILMRMEYPGTSTADENKFRNRLQQRMARMRERFSMVSWRDTAGDTNAIRDRVLGTLTQAQLAARGGLGSTRGSTPGSMDSQGRVIPVPGRRARGTANAGDIAAQVQQLQAQAAHAGPSNTPPQQSFPAVSSNFSDVNSEQKRPPRPDEGSRSSQQNAPQTRLTVEERRELDRYLDQDRTRTQMCADGLISLAQLKSDMERNEAELMSGFKRARGEISDDDEVVGADNQRAKRMKRGEDAVGPSSGPLLEIQRPTSSGSGNLQPGPSGEYHRHGALASTSRRPATRPAGSAVQRLHNDRSRRPAPNATQSIATDYMDHAQPDIAMADEAHTIYNNQRESQQPQEYPLQDGGLGNGNISANVEQSQPRLEPYQSQPGNSTGTSDAHLNSMEPQSRPRSHHQRQPTVRDDPFLSDELFDGMLNGQPDANHVGSMYTRSQQKEIDEYYQRLMAPLPMVELEGDDPNEVMPSPPRFWEGVSTEEPVISLVVGDITLSGPEWSAFVNNHDALPLLRGDYPDEYRPPSPPP